jgi:hypothetical protein
MEISGARGKGREFTRHDGKVSATGKRAKRRSEWRAEMQSSKNAAKDESKCKCSEGEMRGARWW